MRKALLISVFLFVSLSYSDSQWIKSNGPNVQYIYSLLLYGNSLYAATADGMYATTNNGFIWVPKNNGINITYNALYCLMAAGSKIFCGSDSGVYVSTNNGDLWSRKNNGLPQGPARTVKAFLLYNSTNIYAATGSGVYLSTDYGESWIPRNTGIENAPMYSFTVKDNKIYSGSDRKVYGSSDAGLSWVSLGIGFPPTHSSALSLAAMGSNLIAGMCCGIGAYLSTNDGARWEKINNMTANALITHGNRIIAGAIEGVLVSSDSGITWTEYNQGFQFLTTTALAYNAAKIFAGVELYVWYRPVGEIIAVNNISTEIPSSYSLSQNYPNPFNPTTKIKFDVGPPLNPLLAKEGTVVLKIYDVLGREVTTLVNKELKPGIYEAEWTGSNYPSGVYFYQLIADGYIIATKKLTMVK
jgi:photosystem II stability/assembly factor-like uncharacterized protein